MDKLYNGKPYFLMDDLGGKPPIFGNTQELPAPNQATLMQVHPMASPLLQPRWK